MNIDYILEQIYKTVKNHEITPGAYARWLWQNETQERNLGVNAYGCADAANIYYTLNRFPKNEKERAAFIHNIQQHQDAETGMFHEETHWPMHTTAHCVAALELFDASPMYPLKDLQQYLQVPALYDLLESLDWVDKKGCGHMGAGLYSALVINESVTQEWIDVYFGWLDENCDEMTGLWRKNCFTSDLPIYRHMADGFHYLFVYEHAKRAFPYPKQLIDTCLDMYQNGKMEKSFGKRFHFAEVDWVYCLNRASRQTDHRFKEVKAELYDFAEKYVDYLNNVDWERDDGANDMHMLFGALCCLAELQQALPGQLKSRVPLRLVLEKRPFI